jgi:hypothetical protein
VPGREIAENRPKHWKRAFLRSPCASKNPHDRRNFPRLWGEPRETRTGPQERTGFEPRDPSIQPSWIVVSIPLAMNWPHFNPVTSACPSMVRREFRANHNGAVLFAQR